MLTFNIILKIVKIVMSTIVKFKISVGEICWLKLKCMTIFIWTIQILDETLVSKG
jgi:hypothetical protein